MDCIVNPLKFNKNSTITARTENSEASFYFYYTHTLKHTHKHRDSNSIQIFLTLTPALYRSWITRIGAADTSFDLYALSIGRFCSRSLIGRSI